MTLNRPLYKVTFHLSEEANVTEGLNPPDSLLAGCHGGGGGGCQPVDIARSKALDWRAQRASKVGVSWLAGAH